MNCLEFRRQMAVDPQTATAVFLSHRQECARCAQAFGRAQGFESALAVALAVDVPPQLAEHILLRQTTLARQDRGEWRTTWSRRITALAASLVMAAGVGWYSWVDAPALGELAVQHIDAHPHTYPADAELSQDLVRAKFEHEGIPLLGALPAASFAGNCPVGSQRSMHLVGPEAHGGVTMFYVFKQREPDRREFTYQGLRGRSVPMASGTLVLIAADGSRFDALETTWRGALEGDAPKAVASL